ncbi:MAG: flagellar motor switch protein FliG, partial [Myxococcota bacterium]
MPTSVVSEPDKAAVLFLHLDEATAAKVFKKLSRREMRLLSAAARNVAQLESADVTSILTEFIEQIEGTSMALKAGSEFVNNMAKRSLGVDKAREFLGDDGGLADTLADIDSRTISNLVRKEHPQTVALILAHLPAVRAAEVLGQLSESVQGDALLRLADIDNVSPDVVKLVEEAILSELSMAGEGLTRKVGGVSMVADVINSMDKSRELALMRDIEETDEDLAEEIRGMMFVFDDLIFLDAKGIQTLLKEIEREDLILALKAAGDELKDHIFGNMSSRAVEMIREEIESR